MESVRGHWKQQRNANGPANRGSLFNVRHAVLYSLRRFLFIFLNVLYSRFAIQCSPRRSPYAAPFAIRLVIRRAVRHSPRRSPFASSFAAPFAIRRAVSYSFSLFKLRYSMFAAPLAIRSSPFVNRWAIRHSQRHSLSLFNVPWRFPDQTTPWNIYNIRDLIKWFISVPFFRRSYLRRNFSSTIGW